MFCMMYAIICLYVEPITAGGGCIVPPAGYWKRVQEICTQYKVGVLTCFSGGMYNMMCFVMYEFLTLHNTALACHTLPYVPY